jgi:UDP-2,4-diacetamido-2,4,6-trideoxy-beta-L-altropyranose hydrolase
MPTALIRADASSEIGTGHVRRCLALSGEFARRGVDVTFAATAETYRTISREAFGACRLVTVSGDAERAAKELADCVSADFAIVDHYSLDERFESASRRFAATVAAIDDALPRRHECDLLIDATPGRTAGDWDGRVPADCEMLLGPQFALVGKSFRKLRPAALDRRKVASARSLLVNLGGVDPSGLTVPIVEGIAIAQKGKPLSVEIVLGASENALRPAVERIVTDAGLDAWIVGTVADMADPMTRADLAIGAAGSSSWERCCLGLPSVVVIAADNQRPNAKALADAGAAVVVESVTACAVAEALVPLLDDADRLAAMSRAAAAMCDGGGIERSADRILARRSAN